MNSNKRKNRTVDISSSTVALPRAILTLLIGNMFTLDELYKELNRQKPGKWTRSETLTALHTSYRDGYVKMSQEQIATSSNHKGKPSPPKYRILFSRSLLEENETVSK